MSNVPTNLIPTRITGLPEYTGTSTLGYMAYVLDGRTYKVQFSNIAAVGAVPSSRVIATGNGLQGGGDLSQNRTISIIPHGVGYSQLDFTGVTAGTYGSADTIPSLTIDATGRVTAAVNTPVVLPNYVPSSRTVTAGAGLTGGGQLNSNITIALNPSNATPQSLGAASAGTGTQAARDDHVHPAVDLTDTSETQGVLPLGRGGTGVALSPVVGAVIYADNDSLNQTIAGNVGQVLTSAGGLGAPYWQTITGTGTVTSVSVNTANGFAGTVTDPNINPVLTLRTTVTGVIKGDGTAISAATAAVDYVAPGAVTTSGLTMATSRLLGRTTASTGAVEAITVGTGLSLSGGSLTNSAPDQVVSLTGGTAISISGTYPAFTVTNTAPDQIVSLTGAGTTVVTGTYPSFTITSNDQYVGTVTSVAASGGTTGLTFSGTPITTSGTLTLSGTLAVANGGTGATVMGTARTNLGAAASGANTDITSIALTTGTISATPTSGTDIVNKLYADSIASGINFHQSVRLATAAALPANTYNNGASGVGATLTANANGALSVDGVAVVAGNRILVKNEVAGANNGVYTVTQIGSGAAPYILTRATDFDSAGTGVDQIDAGDFFLVTAGSTQSNTSWVQQTPLPITVGTTAIVFTQFAAPVLYSAGTGLTLAGTVFSITNTGVTANTYGSASSVPVIAVNAQGQITSASSTAIVVTPSNFDPQLANTFLAAPNGVYGTPTFRTIVAADVPTLNQNTTGTAANVTGIVAVANGGTGVTTSTGTGNVVLSASPTFTNTVSAANITATGTITVSGGALNSSGAATVGLTATGAITIGSTSSANAITVGRSTASQTLNLATGATASGNTKTVDIGTAGLSGSTTNITIGSAVSGATSTTTLNGTVSIASVIAAPLGSAAAPSYTFTGDTNTGMWSPGADTLAFSEGGVEAMRINSSGNVGIGETAPGARLHVSGGTVGTTAGNLLNVTIDQGLAGGNAVGIRTNLVRVSNGTDWTTTAMRLQGRVDATDFGYIDFVSGGAQGLAFGSDASERMRINASGNVGIGTSSPGKTLDLVGQFRASGSAASGYALLEYGTSATATNNWHVGSEGDGTFRWYNGNFGAGTERMRITSAGFVGIGTSAPSTSQILTLNSGGTATPANGGLAGVAISNTDVTASGTSGILGNLTDPGGTGRHAGAIAFGKDGTWTTGSAYPGNIQFWTRPNSTASEVERMRIGSTGNVGIGETSPGARLHVSGGTVGTTAGNLLNVTIDQGIAGSNTVGVRTNLVRVSSGTDWTTTAMRLQGRVDATDFGYIDFVSGGAQGLAFGSATSERMRINASGNVGIGTASPAQLLHVNGNALLGGSPAAQYSNITISGDAAIQSATPLLNFVNAAGSTRFGYLYHTGSGGNIELLNQQAGAMLFGTNNTERMRIDSSGNVGIGTSSPSVKLDVNGSANFGAAITTGVGVSTGDAVIEVGGSRSGSGNAYIDLHAVTGTDFEARIIRYGGANSSLEINNTGTGGMLLNNSGAAAMVFHTTATERMRIEAGGNVGIGTSSPSGRFTVQATDGNTAFFDSTDTAGGLKGVAIRSIATSGTATPFLALRQWRSSFAGNFDVAQIRFDGLTTTGGYAEFASIYAPAGTNTASGAPTSLAFNTMNTSFVAGERMRISANGEVGIGTSSPASLLHVKRGSNATEVYPTGTWATRVINATDASGENGLLVGNRWAGTGSTVFEVGSIFGGGTGSWYSYYRIDGVGQSIWSNAGTERMRLATDGTVGMGVSTPNASLHIAGIRGGNGRMTQNSTGGTSENNLNIIASSSAGGADQWFSYGVTASNYFFLQTGVGTGDSGLVVNSNNRVMVGTSTAFDTTVGANFMASGSAGSAAAFRVNAATTTQVSFYDSTQSARVGWIGTSGSSTSYNTTSDRRLKKNIQPVGDVGAKIDQIEVVSHEWTNGTDTVIPYAFIAQDLYEAAPHAVSKGDDGDEVGIEWAVDYSKLVPMLVKEVQSLRARVAQLEGK